MTTGSWTVGTNNINSTIYAYKSWSGGDGKYETWAAGKRVKWNSYDMVHQYWAYLTPTDGYGYGSVPGYTLAQAKAAVGWSTNDELRVLNKLAERIKGHSFDLGINIAEADKTYQSILQNLRSLGTALVDLKHGNYAGALRSLGVPSGRRKPLRAKDISGRWLEMQYAWLPLVSQSYEAGKALAAVTNYRSLRFSASGQKTKTIDGSFSPGVFAYPVKLTYSYKILADLYEEVSAQRGLGLYDPLTIGWEIVPYSFVVDWFLPVGSYLSALGMIPYLNGRFLITEKYSGKGGSFVKLDKFPIQMKDRGKVERFFRIKRTPSSSLSVPRPTFNSLPRSLSPAHLYNAVALIHQRLGK